MPLTPANLPATSGVYRIVNAVTGECYVGSSGNIQRRCYQHATLLRLGKHYAKSMLRSFREHGEDVFAFEVLALCEVPELVIREEAWVKAIQPVFNTREKCTVFRAGFGLDPGKPRKAKKKLGRRRGSYDRNVNFTPRRPEYHPGLTHPQRAERRKLIAAAVASGKTVSDVANQFGVAEGTVWAAARQNGVSPRKSKRQARDATILGLHQSGSGVKDISERLGIGEYTVYLSLRRSGVVLKRGRKKGFLQPDNLLFVPRHVWEQVDWTKTDRALAFELMVSQQRVNQVRQRLGKNRKQLRMSIAG